MTVACPGCGVALPASGAHAEPRGLVASPECYEVYGEVVAYGHQHAAVLGRWHQTCVDAYAAQHVGPRTGPLQVCFALNTLYLVLERGYTGLQARAAHGFLANTYGTDGWPRFDPPAHTGDVTVVDVALTSGPEEQAAAVERWGRTVWDAWSHVHAQVRELTDRQLARGWRVPE